MHEFLRHPEILVAGSYPFEMKLINYYAAAFRALAGNEDRVHSTDPDHMFAEQNRKLIGHNPYNSPGHHGFARDRGAFERFFENTIPERLATVFRDLILEYYALVRSDGDKPAPLRVSIVAVDDPARPQFQANLTWDTAPSFGPNTFAFAPPANARVADARPPIH